MSGTPEPPSRVCPHCGREGRTRYERCPHCQRSYFTLSRAQLRRRWLIAGATLLSLLLLGGVGGALAINSRDDREARDRADQARVVAQLRARITREQAPRFGRATRLEPVEDATDAERLKARRALVVAVERRITADARARVRTGELDGPINDTFCGPILKSKQAIPDDRVLSKPIGRYDCVAIKRHIVNADDTKVAELGYAFVAALNFKTYTYTWCRNTPAQGEAGKALVFVRLDRRCLAATGQALGSGYVAQDGELGETSDGAG
ncbi:MAG TPA: hypothetical protein VFG42_21040 [Baekduia sp.]|uniref:hypothetical protein n=1 Tax=Baekduia sp. TaxID=2600305 RepID=UPI002D771888|nr:hypothetical protein [Baekduia sp.]HET6509296.1 hypothetical protein [Baekduia sp.]